MDEKLFQGIAIVLLVVLGIGMFAMHSGETEVTEDYPTLTEIDALLAAHALANQDNDTKEEMEGKK